MIVVNLPVADLETSRAFYTGLGFRINEAFSDETTASVVLSGTIVAMLMTRERFAGFVTGEVADAHRVTQVLHALSADSREEVDTFVARALAHGGHEYRDTQEGDGMYGRAVADPDGHVWEVVHMAEPEGGWGP
ncbi:VOC family protein [Cellulomonas endophytica]|uniref:VOC family protein n=1 Tax=Cellulomonas endophytica TaxID=2494735 RepID=UPI001F0B8A35|nr:VOC family protein [Cellulomonas endophytica]